ncbi:MAG: hypothetical protein RR426_10235, partial [Oscillospiraceae bacterium]
MNGWVSAAALAAAFVTGYIERQDLSATLALLTEDVTWAAAPDPVCGKGAVSALLKRESRAARTATVRSVEETVIAQSAVSALVTVDLPEEARCLQLTLSCRRSGGSWLICAVFLPMAERGDESTAIFMEELMDDYLPGGFLVCTPYPGFS